MKHILKEPIRARRRRLKCKATENAIKFLKSSTWTGTEEELIEYAKKLADNKKKCSCYMCGNPRRNFLNSADDKLTRNERQEWVAFVEQCDEDFLRQPTNKRAGKYHGR